MVQSCQKCGSNELLSEYMWLKCKSGGYKNPAVTIGVVTKMISFNTKTKNPREGWVVKDNLFIDATVVRTALGLYLKIESQMIPYNGEEVEEIHKVIGTNNSFWSRVKKAWKILTNQS